MLYTGRIATPITRRICVCSSVILSSSIPRAGYEELFGKDTMLCKGIRKLELYEPNPAILRSQLLNRNPHCFRRLTRAVAVIGLLVTLSGCYSGTRPPRIGSNAPDFTVRDVDRQVTLSQFRGQVVVLNFWATWCPPCVQEIPSLVLMQQRLRDKGVVVVAVSVDVDDEAYHRFLNDNHVNLLTVRDPDQKSPGLYGTHGWPETYIIDRTGILRRKFIGPIDWTTPEVTEFLTKL
jgi:cytochrome c biogenesis protein CcmG, thiol:disulfide interchange protein DsbE